MKVAIHVIFWVIKFKVDVDFEYLLYYLLWSSTRAVFFTFCDEFLGSLYRIFFTLLLSNKNQFPIPWNNVVLLKSDTV